MYSVGDSSKNSRSGERQFLKRHFEKSKNWGKVTKVSLEVFVNNIWNLPYEAFGLIPEGVCACNNRQHVCV